MRMIERVARILDPKAFKVLDENDKWRIMHFHGDRVAAKAMAKEIISAMREPTKPMISSGYDVGYSPDPLPTDDVWRSMIDAALKETDNAHDR